VRCDKARTIAHQRLGNQRIAWTTFRKPSAVVAWLAAVQAQDYLGALWAVGLRTRNATEADVERALADRSMVRTWLLRGTLHFVAAADVRWMLELLTPRVVAGSAWRLRQLDVDDATLARSQDVFVKALQGGKQLRRDAMYALLDAAHISTSGGRGLHILWRLAHEGLICFGAREGKQHTFALLDEWVPSSRTLEGDEALAELARRYFTSHGPATLQDFAWWSGLTPAEARAGVDLATRQLGREIIGGQAYWRSSSMPKPQESSSGAYLLPPYDEYTVAYKDRSAVLNPMYAKLPSAGNGIFNPSIVVDGQVVGTWKRTREKDAVTIASSPFAKLTSDETSALAVASERYRRFVVNAR
jgi:hypothetical protein